jgi:hypothetical protein
MKTTYFNIVSWDFPSGNNMKARLAKVREQVYSVQCFWDTPHPRRHPALSGYRSA